jgi:hypothetical protein
MSGAPDLPPLRLDWIDAEAARFACSRWHYSRTMPANKSARIGVWEGEDFKGAIIFGLGASPSLGKPYGLGIFEICELTRIALREHCHPVSQMMAIAIRMIKAGFPGLRLIVSFADQHQGHHGGIYQATNWLYAGETASAKMIELPDGKLADPRRFNGHGHNKAKPIPSGSREIRTPPKYRYLMPLDRKMRRQIEPLRFPYPKRASELPEAL